MPDTQNYQNSMAVADMDAAIPTLYAAKVYQEAIGRMYWERFSGPEGSGLPIIVKSELLQEAGDKIEIIQLMNLDDESGVTGEAVLTGNEQKLTPRGIQTVPDYHRNGVSMNVKTKKAISFDFRDKAQLALGNWMAKKRDNEVWAAANRKTVCGFENAIIPIIYAGDATAFDDIDPSDEFSVDMIRNAAAVLADKDVPKVSIPGMPDGEGYYLCFINPFQALSLRKDPDWISNHRSASERGADNPLFTSALGEISGVIIHETTQCKAVENANSPVTPVATAVMVGAEALCTGEGQEVGWYEEYQDYGFRHGIAISAAWQTLPLSSNAIIQLPTAAVNPKK